MIEFPQRKTVNMRMAVVTSPCWEVIDDGMADYVCHHSDFVGQISKQQKVTPPAVRSRRCFSIKAIVLQWTTAIFQLFSSVFIIRQFFKNVNFFELTNKRKFPPCLLACFYTCFISCFYTCFRQLETPTTTRFAKSITDIDLHNHGH